MVSTHPSLLATRNPSHAPLGTGRDFPAPERCRARPSGRNARGRRSEFSRFERSGSGAPLHPAVHMELWRGHGHVPAGFVHHEIQSQDQRKAGGSSGICRGSPAAAGQSLPGGAQGDVRAGTPSGRNHRHGRGFASAGRRGSRGTRGHAHLPCLSREQRLTPLKNHRPRYRPRHQPGQCPSVRIQSGQCEVQ